MRKKEKVVLKYKGWIIRKDEHNYILQHETDKKMHFATYYSTLSHALEALYEKILLDKMEREDYDASLLALKKAIEETNEEFKAILTPKLLEKVKEYLENKKEIQAVTITLN